MTDATKQRLENVIDSVLQEAKSKDLTTDQIQKLALQKSMPLIRGNSLRGTPMSELASFMQGIVTKYGDIR